MQHALRTVVHSSPHVVKSWPERASTTTSRDPKLSWFFFSIVFFTFLNPIMIQSLRQLESNPLMPRIERRRFVVLYLMEYNWRYCMTVSCMVGLIHGQ